MTARGVDFLDNWIENDVPPEPGDWARSRKLGQKLREDAMVVGFTRADLELDRDEAEKLILGSMMYRDTPGTSVD